MNQINNIRLPSPSIDCANLLWSFSIDERDFVRSISPMNNLSIDNGEDWDGDWLSPMGLDLQFNGGFGVSFNSLQQGDLPIIFELLEQLWLDGVEAICPTLVTCSIDSLRRSLEILHQVRKENPLQSCKLLGAHLEGPFLARNFRGAHDVNHLEIPSLSALNERIKGYEDEIALVTLAPELPGSIEVLQRLIEMNVVVSLGHSGASANLCSEAFDKGVTMITHAFNAMPGIHHRAPGPIAEAIQHGEISLGLIADGVHVHPTIVKIIQRLAPGKIVLISDALSPYGMSKERFKWDHRELIVSNDLCKLEDGTLVGTTLPLLEACRRLAEWTKENSSAIWSATVAPRIALKQGEDVQEFLIGKSLRQLLRWHVAGDSKELTWKHAK